MVFVRLQPRCVWERRYTAEEPTSDREGDQAMAEEKARGAHSARLCVWNQLFHGVPVDLEKLIPEPLCGDVSSPDEQAAYVTLRACTALARSERRVIRWALRVAILYWFSNLGEPHSAARKSLEPKRSAFHLAEAIGTRLTWDEAVAAMKRKPLDLAAYGAVLERIEEEYQRQWDLVFPATRRESIEALRDGLRGNSFARTWCMESGERSSRSPGVRRNVT